MYLRSCFLCVCYFFICIWICTPSPLSDLDWDGALLCSSITPLCMDAAGWPDRYSGYCLIIEHNKTTTYSPQLHSCYIQRLDLLHKMDIETLQHFMQRGNNNVTHVNGDHLDCGHDENCVWKNSYNLRAYSGRDVCVCNSQIKTCYVASMKPSPLKLLSNFPVILFSRRMFQIWAHSSHHLLARNVSEYAKKSNYSNALLAAEKSWPCISSTALYKTIQIRDADFFQTVR